MKNETAEAESDACRFLKLGSGKLDFSHERFYRGGNRDTRIAIRRDDNGKLSIAYEFNSKEAAILELLSEISGIAIEDLANDAAGWTRGYVNELPEYATGQVFDLLDMDGVDGAGAFANDIPRSHRKRTRAFLMDLREVWKFRRAARARPRHTTLHAS